MSDVARLLSSAKYLYQDQTRRDVANVLNLYRGLKPRLEKCTLPTGTKRELLCLKGTIPVSYRNSVYNIPVSLWILHNHPESAPICWVNPTKDMTIKVSRHVDESGRIFLPYLSEWNSTSNDLLGVIQVMIILFGETPPLYSKPKTTASESSSSTAYTTAASNPPNPPYPTNFQNQYFGNVYPAINPITASTSSTPYSQTTEAPTNPSYPFSKFQMMPNYASPNSTTGSINSDTISKEHIRLSLLSALEDKLKSRSKEIVSQYNAEIDVLKKTGEDLNKGKIKLDNLVKTIETNLVELNKCKEKINNKNAKINEYLTKLESSKEKLNIDEYFGPVQPLYKQLLNAFVEENSIVDTVYYLNLALQKDVIDLDIFIKNVRELSRRQFMLRALIKLCREKAGLPT